MEINKWHIPAGRANNPGVKITPKEIILHYVGNPGTSARANANYFVNVCKDQTSVNYIVDEHYIYEIIPAGYKSYGTSDGAHNGKAIQIEMCHPDATGRITEPTLANVVWLCGRLMEEFGALDIIRHYDVTGKKCPLWYVGHPGEWDALKARIKGVVTMDNKPSEWSREAVNWALEKGIMKGDEKGDLRLRDAVTREELCVMLYRALAQR